MVTKRLKLKSWKNFIEFLKEMRSCNSNDEYFDEYFKCEIYRDEILEDGLPLEFIVVNDCGEFTCFDTKHKAESYISEIIEDNGCIDAVWYQDDMKEFSLSAKIKI